MDERLKSRGAIRTLELQLFERERGPEDADVELVSLLDTPASPRPSRRFGARVPTSFRYPGRLHRGKPGVIVDRRSAARKCCARRNKK